MNINSYMPVEVISGKDCLKNSVEKLTSLGKSCLIVTGGSSAKICGALSDAEAVLKSGGISYVIFDGITQNPVIDDCFRAGKLARETGAEFILGIGGGSPLDASKAIAIYAENPELSPVDIYKREYNHTPLPVVLVGTTAGTGSEVTGVSVLTNSKTGMKKSISGHDCYAVISFCDSTYTESAPYGITVSTALDAFAHATESYFSKISNDLSSLYAEKAICILWKNLKLFLQNKDKLPDSKIRSELYEASLLAGLAINITGTCFPHTVGYILTEDYSIPHGRACAAFTPEFIKIASENEKEKADRFFGFIGSTEAELDFVISSLADVKIEMTAEQCKKYGDRWQSEIKNFSRTPGDFTKDTAVRILHKYVK